MEFTKQIGNMIVKFGVHTTLQIYFFNPSSLDSLLGSALAWGERSTDQTSAGDFNKTSLNLYS